MKALSNRLNFWTQLIIGFLLAAILIAVPTGYEGALIYTESEKCKAEVISTDESSIISTGLIQSGEQICQLELLDGKFKGEKVSGINLLSGSLENDKIYSAGDEALVVVSYNDGGITSVTMTDHYRVDKEIILALMFVILLILFAGKNGMFAVLSFVITVLMIWKILVPCYLKGMNPMWVGMGITVALTAVIIFLVYGVDKRTLTAFMGSMLGTVTTCIIGLIFTDLFKIHGAVMSYSETLLYCGYQHLNLTQIFTSGIFIGASGYFMERGGKIGDECRTCGDGHNDHYASSCIFGRIYSVAYDVYGAGNTYNEYSELQICCFGNTGYAYRKLRTCYGSSVYGSYERTSSYFGTEKQD